VEKTLASPACKTQNVSHFSTALDDDYDDSFEMLEQPEMAEVAKTSFFRT
jgi:hypothetical protein